MEIRRTHHISFLIMGIICMVLMLTCLTGFIVSAASGSGINSNAASNEKYGILAASAKITRITPMAYGSWILRAPATDS